MHPIIRKIPIVILVLACTAMCRGQTIKVQASETLAGLGRELAQAYMASHSGSSVTVTSVATPDVFAALRDGRAQLAQLPRALRFREAQACEQALGRRPTECKFGVIGLAILVHKDNAVASLTYEQLEGIFHGQYTNWRQLGGLDAPIQPYGQPTNSAAGEFFQEEVLNGKVFAPSVHILPGEDMARALARDTNGIGFGALAQSDGIRLVPIKRAISSTPVTPDPASISNRIYPISRYLYTYASPQADEAAVNSYLDWMRGDEGQAVVKRVGYFPLPAKLRARP